MNNLLTHNIPPEIRSYLQWVAWKSQERDVKVTKIPVNPQDGRTAATNKPSTWRSFEEAIEAIPKFGLDGIGFVFTPNDPYVGIDLDRCLDPGTGTLEEWAERYVRRFKSYVEISPSGRGLHILVKGSLPPGGRRKGPVEMYDRGRFFTFTGNVYDGTVLNVEDRNEELGFLHQELFGTPNGPARAPQKLPFSDSQLIEKAMASSNGNKFRELWSGNWQSLGYPSQSEADQALCDELAFWCGNDPNRIDRLFKKSGLYREKWDRPDYARNTVMKAIAFIGDSYRRNPTDSVSPQYPTALGAGVVEKVSPKKQGDPEISFPVQVISGVAGAFANLFGSYTESPIQFYYFAFLTCLGNILADRLTIESQIAPQPRLYCLILGESADDRKSTAISQTVKFFGEAQTSIALSVCNGVGSAEGLQERLKQDGKLTLCLDEFKSFVSKCKIEASVLLPCVTTLFESNSYESTTRQSGIRLKNVHLSLLAASTVDTYENVWSSQFTDIGFNNRLWLVTGRGARRFSIPRKIPANDIMDLRFKLEEVLRIVGEGRELPIGTDAWEVYDQWYMNGDSSVHAKRLDTYALRLMPLLAVNAGKLVIDVETVRNVIALCDWQLHVRKLHDPIDADNGIAKMEEKIRRTLRAKGPHKDHKLKTAVHAHRAGLWFYETAKRNLLDAKEIVYDPRAQVYRAES